MWRISKWQFDNSESNSFGGGLVWAIQAGKGAFYLRDPAGKVHQFKYADLGLGVGFGVSGPVGGTVSGKGTPSSGRISENPSVGNQLMARDLTGVCAFGEVSAGFGTGGSITQMILGLPVIEDFDADKLDEELESLELASYHILTGQPVPRSAQRGVLLQALQLTAARGVAGQRLPQSAQRKVINLDITVWARAKAMLNLAGLNVGLQAGASGVLGLGVVWQGNLEDLVPKKSTIEIPFEVELVRLRSSNGKQELKLIIPSDALFDFDMDKIGTKKNPDAAPRLLANVANILRAESAYRILVVGYTDSIGKEKYNQGLSERRANKVRDWLIVFMGIEPARFLAVRGEGEFSPVAPNNTPTGRAKNRRVEITLVPR